MKIVVVGKGNTGQAVLDLLGSQNIYEVFDSNNIVTVEKLNNADAVIVFVSAKVLQEILPVLLETKTPIICGATGFDYTQSMIEQIIVNKNMWIIANNFSLSMVFIKEALNSLGKIQYLIPQLEYTIKETHHTRKLDAPSGTAISWKNWLDVDSCKISSERLGDIKGIHKAELSYEYETIELKHTAHDRKLFAQGAIWAAKYAVNNSNLYGFYQFEELVAKEYANEY
ncbi:dihydrodipicolinate reductase C-terminal domain-containing protein [Francisella sp. 19X1-34]|uniref:dihydrodipicolinate reductase C-terminal domain-containing protein n=1 Tax=Francisella sp. 19X1-34 TaxID=3087177 RepID=UPI002E353CB5|nr:dihydrodipicolinate reductase C-terminal domain-containing protein [Francisella sp. 19X1-34]MED7787673.1 dihydrodipicolinate reductase C-terminal domain-containing protein [Francisella sp. 19X1-34]